MSGYLCPDKRGSTVLNSYIFKDSQAYSMCYDGGITNHPLAVARRVITTDSGLCYHGDLNTLHYVSCPWHAVSVKNSVD